jgi:PAS domain S-box-containing protein
MVRNTSSWSKILSRLYLIKIGSAGTWIVAVYVLFGSLWILFSDTILGHITRNPDLVQRISVFKGLSFILVTAVLLYHLIKLHLGRMSAVNSRLTASMEHLKAVNEKLKLTDFSIDNISDAIQWITMDTRFWNVNQAACSMLGYSREELLSMSISDIDPYFRLDEWQVHLKDIMQSGSIQHARFHKTKDGRIFPVEITSSYIQYNDIGYYCAIVRDNTQRIKAEEEASFYRSLIEFTRDPFYVLSPDNGFKMVYANRAACEHYGMSLEQLQTMSIPDWDPQFDMGNIDELMQRLRQGKSIRIETVHRVASGKLVPVELTSSHLVHGGREYTCGYFYNITARKAMDEALKQSEARYRALSFEYQALLDGLPDGLTLLSPDLLVLWANPASAQNTALQQGDLIGHHCHEMRHASAVPCDKCIVRDTFATGRAGKTISVYPATGRTFELRSVPVKDEDEKVAKVIEIARDISAQVAAEAERIELERKLLHAQKLESLGILAGGIAHDFNNILTSIMGNLSIFRMQIPEGHKILDRIEKCEQAVQQATGLTCQLLTFAKGGDPVKKTTDLRHVIQNAVTFALTGSNVTVQVTIEDDLWAVEADEGQIGQVLNNLLINGHQAMLRGGAIHVGAANRLLARNEATALKEGPYVAIVVRDQGMGIAPEHLAKIFDPYFTTKKTGTGLGLTSAYSIIRKHGGDIFVTSEVGKGTTFEVCLPAIPVNADCEDSSMAQSISAGKGSVLLMDDEECIRDLTCEMLSHLGYHAEACSCGEELIRIYQERAKRGHTPDAVIIDLTIRGGMGGLDAATAILAFDPSARLIVASGYSTDPVMANYRKYGFAAALPKPYRLEDISCELARVMKGQVLSKSTDTLPD